jgi:hypothetical protein
MFGELKESVLSNLENTMSNKGEKDLKSAFAKYVKVLRENNSLREFNETYNLLNELKFDDELVAKEFVEESIKHLKTLDGSCTDELKKLTEVVVSIEGTINNSIDQLVFNDKLPLLEKVTHKTILIKNLMKSDVETVSLQESMDKISDSLTDKISQLNEEQVKALNIFAENDSSKITEYYDTLIEDTKNLVDKTINESDDIIVVKKLLSVNVKLNEMKKNIPTLETIDEILDLNKTLI